MAEPIDVSQEVAALVRAQRERDAQVLTALHAELQTRVDESLNHFKPGAVVAYSSATDLVGGVLAAWRGEPMGDDIGGRHAFCRGWRLGAEAILPSAMPDAKGEGCEPMTRHWTARDHRGWIVLRSERPETLLTFVRRLKQSGAWVDVLSIRGEEGEG